MFDRSKAQLISHLPQANYLWQFSILPIFYHFPNRQTQNFGWISYCSLFIIHIYNIYMYIYFLEILSSECSRPCLNCYVLTATFLVYDLIAVCSDYYSRLLVTSLSVCSNYYFHDATLLRALDDFFKASLVRCRLTSVASEKRHIQISLYLYNQIQNFN